MLFLSATDGGLLKLKSPRMTMGQKQNSYIAIADQPRMQSHKYELGRININQVPKNSQIAKADQSRMKSCQ